MEIKLNAGDKIQIPANCKATIEDNQIIIEEKKEEFKEGDILHSNITGQAIIFKSYEDESCKTFCTYYNSANFSKSGWVSSYSRHATEEEKQSFFDELKAKGLRWNAKTKQMEKIRRRAEWGETYLYITSNCKVYEMTDAEMPLDDENYILGNYYLPEERAQAEADAEKVRAIFQERLNKTK